MSEKNVVFYLAGDSTVTSCSSERYPEAGWGQVIGEFLKENVSIKNYAVGGRSSKSFINEKRLEQIKREIKQGDFLLIQFGHNDQKEDEERRTEPFTTYKEYLKEYIAVARNASATPILITSVSRRTFDESGKIVNSHGDYHIALKELAKEMDVELIDLCERSMKLFEDIGVEKTKNIFIWLESGIYPNYLDGREDNTHFSEHGAREIAKLIVEGIKENKGSVLEVFLK